MEILANELIQRFLDASDQDVWKATRKIHRYFYLRQEPGPIFRDRNPSSPTNQKLFGPLYAIPVRNHFNDGEVFLLTGLLHPTTRYSLLAHFKLIALVIDYLVWDTANRFTTLKILIDGKNFLNPQLLENPYRHLKSFVRDFQISTPVNLEGFYLVRPPSYMTEIARIHDGLWLNVLETPEEVSVRFPTTLLPFEYGGRLGPLEELLGAWNLQVKQRSKFFAGFERRMVCDYNRRMCHEREVKEGGKSWVWRMRLYEEETEYKKKYYERMGSMKPVTHPAYGRLRRMNKPREPKVEDPLKKLRELVGDEESVAKFPSARRRTSASREDRRPPDPVELYLCIS